MDFNKYYKNGWGLHWKTSEYIFNILKDNDINNILEFGSGKSTEFFIDSRNELTKNYSIDSFDHSTQYCYQGQTYYFLNLMIRDLIICDDDSYNTMFKSKKYTKELFLKTDDIFNTGIKNATYDIHSDDLKENYDLVLIDGPNGNGRNFAYFYLTGRIKSGAYVIIDDYFHYDFLEKCSIFFDYEVLETVKFSNDHPNKGHAIIKIK
jgi:hypothetical protein